MCNVDKAVKRLVLWNLPGWHSYTIIYMVKM